LEDGTGFARLQVVMKANQEEMKANQEDIITRMETKIGAEFETIQQRMDEEEMKAQMSSITYWIAG
jgi:hypothetical protein